MLRTMRMAAMAVALTLALTGLALAHDDDDDDYYRGNSQNARHYGYQNGYRDGVHHGREDRVRDAGYDFRSEQWEHAQRGYQPWMGAFGQFKQGYREGYRAGYDTGFYGRGERGDIFRGGWWRGDGDDDDRVYRPIDPVFRGGPWGNGSQGYNFGYQDGASVAREDMARRKPFNPNPRGRYDDADHGYRREYGDKHAYRVQYSNGYRAGYEATFRRY